MAEEQTSLSLSRRWLKRLVFIVYLLMLLELASRAFWFIKSEAVPLGPDAIRLHFYPQLRQSKVLETPIVADNDQYDVLLLGASVLHKKFGSIAAQLQQQLNESLDMPARVFNLSYAGHTSRDSYLKYRDLIDKQFDLVVIYHGMNDVRLNNCPDQMFKADYTHCAWYYQLQRLDNSATVKYVMLPYTCEYLVSELLEWRRIAVFIPRGRPLPGWEAYGRQVRTGPSFRRHLTDIVEHAEQRRQTVLLMSFAHLLEGHEPEEVSPKAAGIRVWGTSEGIREALRQHNDVVYDLVQRYNHVLFVDQHRMISVDPSNFTDVCHLSEQGCQRFVQNMLEPILAHVGRADSAASPAARQTDSPTPDRSAQTGD